MVNRIRLHAIFGRFLAAFKIKHCRFSGTTDIQQQRIQQIQQQQLPQRQQQKNL
jgi:hypothetical protein